MSESKTFVRKIITKKNKEKNKFVDIEAGLDSADSVSSDSSERSDNSYDFDDDFLVSDDVIEEEQNRPTSKASLDSLMEDMFFERTRAKLALEEVHEIRRRIKTLKRKFKVMAAKKMKWQKRAVHLKSIVDKQPTPKTKPLLT